MKGPLPPLEWDPVSVQLKGFARGLAEIQWLLVALVLLYLVFFTGDNGPPVGPLAATGVYFAFSLAANYLTLFSVPYRWGLALQTWVMIGFITWLIYATGAIDGPLVGLYILAVITSALTLGKLATVLEVAAIASCYLLLLYVLRGVEAFAGHALAMATADVLTFLLVGYLTTVLADAIYFANKRMQMLASTDELTGLYNRAAFGALGRPLLAGAQRYGRSMALLLIDVDNLKLINDRLGHKAGDEAIVAIGSRLRTTMRESDVVARYAGDEFVALLPETSTDGAVELANRLLAQQRTESALSSELTTSIGVAQFPAHGDTLDTLLDHADRAMYNSKEEGGGRVTVFQPNLRHGGRASR